MKVAIPLFTTRVAPRFDVAENFLFIQTSNGEIRDRQLIPAGSWESMERVRRLTELGVDTLICGGIDRLSSRQLTDRGVQVFSWITGEAEDALACFLRGELESGVMMGPGGRCCGQWRFRRHGKNPRTRWTNKELSEEDMSVKKEVMEMPRGDGTGPAGKGPATGRGRGPCDSSQTGQGPGKTGDQGRGRGKGGGRGRGGGKGRGQQG